MMLNFPDPCNPSFPWGGGGGVYTKWSLDSFFTNVELVEQSQSIKKCHSGVLFILCLFFSNFCNFGWKLHTIKGPRKQRHVVHWRVLLIRNPYFFITMHCVYMCDMFSLKVVLTTKPQITGILYHSQQETLFRATHLKMTNLVCTFDTPIRVF